MNRKPHQRDETSGYGYMAALEVLKGNTTISVCCQKADILERALTTYKKPVYSKNLFHLNYFQRFCKDDSDFEKVLQETGMMQNVNDI